MNGREQKYPVALFVVIEISSLLILTISLAGTTLFRTTVGQPEDQQNTFNTDSISNQTSNLTNQSNETVDSIQNQTMDNQTGADSPVC